MNAFLSSDIAYEVAGLMYYLFFLFMSRKQNAGRFSKRSRVLTLLAAIALVGTAIFHYSTSLAGIAAMVALALASLASTIADSRAA